MSSAHRFFHRQKEVVVNQYCYCGEPATHAIRYSNRTEYYCQEHLAGVERIIEEIEDEGPVVEPEVVNGYIFYKTKKEVQEAFVAAMDAGRVFFEQIDEDLRVIAWTEEGYYITHGGNDDDLPDGEGYKAPTDEQMQETLAVFELLAAEQRNAPVN
jgi:hypothetical protein